MIDAAIVGADDRGRRLWEALMACGVVDIVAFVDADRRRRRRPFLGVAVRPFSWLTRGTWDHIVAATPAAAGQLARLGIAPDRLVLLPADAPDDDLAAAAATRFPDPLRGSLAGVSPVGGARVGIFGTGAAGMKVWEALTDMDDAHPAWFADNNAQQQGRTLLWLDVIAPACITERPFDAVVVGSMSRDPIRRQLIALGVPAARILTPDVNEPPDGIRAQLADALGAREPSGTRQ